MNYLLIPTLLIATCLFMLGVRWAHRLSKGLPFRALCGFGVIIAIPGVIFAAYYLKIFSEPIWLYEFRSLPFTELTAAGAGLLPGLLHGRFSANQKFRRIAGRNLFPGVLLIGILVPYLKPMVRPPHWNQFQDKWLDDVCIQTSESSCGPACAATLLRRFSKSATEQQIARASFPSLSGTENWYLARTLRSYGLNVRFVHLADASEAWPFPAIAGVRLPSSGTSGHFITVLDRVGDQYIIGDTLEGKKIQSKAELAGDYVFTGFFMIVK